MPYTVSYQYTVRVPVKCESRSGNLAEDKCLFDKLSTLRWQIVE